MPQRVMRSSVLLRNRGGDGGPAGTVLHIKGEERLVKVSE